MRGVYSIPFRISALAAARTLLYITPASNTLVEVQSTKVTNESNETNEQLSVIWQKITTLGTPTGTTVTPTPTEPGDQAAAGTYKANITASEPTYGAHAQGSGIANAHQLEGFPSLSGYAPSPTPEEKFVITNAASWGLYLLVAPSVAIDVNINVIVREIG